MAWRIERSALFNEHVAQEFPAGGGGTTGRPSSQVFNDTVLSKIERLLETHFEAQPEAVPGVRFVMTHALPLVPACVIYAGRVGDHVELLDLTVDWDYWETVGDDPTD